MWQMQHDQMSKLRLTCMALSLKNPEYISFVYVDKHLKTEKFFFFLSFMTTLIDLRVMGKKSVNKACNRKW